MLFEMNQMPFYINLSNSWLIIHKLHINIFHTSSFFCSYYFLAQTSVTNMTKNFFINLRQERKTFPVLRVQVITRSEAQFQYYQYSHLFTTANVPSRTCELCLQ